MESGGRARRRFKQSVKDVGLVLVAVMLTVVDVFEVSPPQNRNPGQLHGLLEERIGVEMLPQGLPVRVVKGVFIGQSVTVRVGSAGIKGRRSAGGVFADDLKQKETSAAFLLVTCGRLVRVLMTGGTPVGGGADPRGFLLGGAG